ncbi:MAG: LD-carboxypeptidase [Pseudomonadales bacterium]|jgi:muramoyltetrapeptide carboxypeptidase|nr:LD-carboxypeptidase [Pseudomonadales bacterium]
MAWTRRSFLGATGALALAPAVPARAAAAVPGGRAPLPPKRPPRLEPGMTVALVTPASNVPEDEDLDAALDLVRSLGFEARPSPNLRRRRQYLAGTDAERAADLNAAFADPAVDAIFCVRGGYGSARLLPRLDYAAIAANPKVLLGYSDITALLNAIRLRTGLVTFHGPIAGQNFSPYTYEEYRRVLVAGEAGAIAAPPPIEARPGFVERENRLTRIVPGRAEGPLVGGNLTLLVHLLGTPFEPDFDGAILFLEDVDEPPYSVDRMLTHLWLSGRLERVAGIAFGKFTEADYDGNTLSIEEVLRDRCEPLGIPTLRGLMIGHVEDQTVVPLGVRARLDVDAGTLSLLEPAVT